jgi:flagellar biosynthesis protein FlhA
VPGSPDRARCQSRDVTGIPGTVERVKPVGKAQLFFPMAVVMMIVVMVLPLPSSILDLLICFNIATSILVLLVSMNVSRPLEFSTFPSMLLILTLARLGLNVSTTRAILSRGEAGAVIHTFGSVVVAGSIVVGLVVFLILTVVQFVVVANGAGRVSEVSARFTLDAMPGKQMAIDADLAAGLLDEQTARKRRKEVSDEADFYGAMDGASKFVKGDAIAGIIIVLVNLLGGFVIGVAQKGLSLSEAITKYSLLSVGDGLVSQIPALLLSVASGLIVTRAASDGDLGSDVVGQFARQWFAMRTGGLLVIGLALVPGLPKLHFIVLGGGLVIIAQRMKARAQERQVVEDREEAAAISYEAAAPSSPQQLAMDARTEAIELDLAYDLVELVEAAGGDLLERIASLRRKIAGELGFVIPPVRTRDDAALEPNTYVLRVHGVELGRGEVPPNRVLVLADDFGTLPGEDVREPVFGLPGRWVPVEYRSQAELLGATVVDRAALIITHLSEVIRRKAGTLLSRQDTKALMDGVRLTDPAVVDDLQTTQVSIGEVQRVLSNLLDENVPIKDLIRILEALSERARTSRSPEHLTEAVRAAIGPSIASELADEGILRTLVLSPAAEQTLAGHLMVTEQGSSLELPPPIHEALVSQIVAHANDGPDRLCVTVSGALRPSLRRLLRPSVPHVAVLAYPEIPDHLEVDVVAVLDGLDAPVAA